MCDVELLDVSNLAQTGDLAIDRIEFTGGLELALPGILIVACHIVVSVVTSYNHQRTKNNFLESCVFNFCNNSLAFCIFWLTFYSSNESVCKSKIIHL